MGWFEACFEDLPDPRTGHATFSRLFRLLASDWFARCFGRFVERLGAGVVAIDGKTLRRSFDAAAGQCALHVVTAFACERRLVLAQAAVAGKENEILAARDLLTLLDIKGMLVTADGDHGRIETRRHQVWHDVDWLIPTRSDTNGHNQ